ncbi:hypothetical protein EBZ39_03555 [bacterium]|nr:hypothetical protein [bacterium]
MHFQLLFLALAQRIASVKNTANESVFRYIDQDLGQLEYHDGKDVRPPVSFPCALIDVAQFKYTELGQNMQQAVGTITIRIGFPPFSATSAGTPSQYQSKALAYYALEQALAVALHGWLPTLATESTDAEGDVIKVEAANEVLHRAFGSMVRTDAETEQRADFIRVRTLTFSIGLEDITTAWEQHTAPKPLPVFGFEFE